MLEKLRDIFVMLAPYIVGYVSDYIQNRRARAKYVPGARMPWNLTVVVMDGSDRHEHGSCLTLFRLFEENDLISRNDRIYWLRPFTQSFIFFSNDYFKNIMAELLF